MFKSWSLKSKIMFAFTAIAFGLLVVGAVGTYTTMKVSSQYSTIPKQDVPNIDNVGDLKSFSWELRVAVNRLRYSLTVASETSAKDVKQNLETIESVIAEYEKTSDAYETIPSRPPEDKVFKVMDVYWDKTQADLKELVEIAKHEKPDISAYDNIFFSKYVPDAKVHIESLEKLSQAHKDGADTEAAAAEASAKYGMYLALGVVVFGFAAALIVGILFSASLTKTFTSLSERLRVGADSVAGESQKIAASSSQLSASTTEQAAALQETVSAVDEVSAMINKNADNAKQSKEVAGHSESSATKGRDAVSGLIGSIDDISRSNAEIMGQIEDSNRQMSEIVKVITEIGTKTKVINDIVFQTKLLSFNASVEAARAGEHGKGFAVVAEEVGNLAQMSGNAAKEISEMLDASSHRVEGIVAETKTKIDRLVHVGREKLEDGTTRARECGHILEEIVGNVTQVGQLMNEISTASTEQSQGVQEITRAMAQLDQVTQQNAVASQDSANASEQLSNEAEELRSIIEELNMTVSGQAVRAADGRKPAAKPHAKAAAKQTAKTLEFKKPASKSKAAPVAHKQNLKKASGDDSIPSENDPRFEDV